MPDDCCRPVSIILTAAQVAAVARASEQQPSGSAAPDDSDRRLSQSLLRGLALLGCFAADGGPRGIVELARELQMSPSTAHRYAVTLVELGLLERCPQSRKYRLAET